MACIRSARSNISDGDFDYRGFEVAISGSNYTYTLEGVNEFAINVHNWHVVNLTQASLSSGVTDSWHFSCMVRS